MTFWIKFQESEEDSIQYPKLQHTKIIAVTPNLLKWLFLKLNLIDWYRTVYGMNNFLTNSEYTIDPYDDHQLNNWITK
jgi:hypothetical protein